MTCRRCGHCCLHVGSTFWTHGDFAKWPDLQKRADAVELAGDDALPCYMLVIRHGKAYCYIELIYGKEAKPQVCRDYPESGPCFFEQQFTEEQGK